MWRTCTSMYIDAQILQQQNRLYFNKIGDFIRQNFIRQNLIAKIGDFILTQIEISTCVAEFPKRKNFFGVICSIPSAGLCFFSCSIADSSTDLTLSRMLSSMWALNSCWWLLFCLVDHKLRDFWLSFVWLVVESCKPKSN